jgi:hypothetical protein
LISVVTKEQTVNQNSPCLIQIVTGSKYSTLNGGSKGSKGKRARGSTLFGCMKHIPSPQNVSSSNLLIHHNWKEESTPIGILGKVACKRITRSIVGARRERVLQLHIRKSEHTLPILE